MKDTIDNRRFLIRFKIRREEGKNPKTFILAARVIVGLMGLLFLLIAVGVFVSGIRESSWGVATLSAILGLGAAFLIWSAITSNRRDVCDAAIVFLADFLFGVVG